MQVQFAFQDGFANDDVIVRVNGKEIIRASNLQGQDPMIPLAAVRDVQVDADTGSVNVEVPTRGLSRSFNLDFRKSPYVGFAIIGDNIALRRSSKPFEYM